MVKIKQKTKLIISKICVLLVRLWCKDEKKINDHTQTHLKKKTKINKQKIPSDPSI